VRLLTQGEKTFFVNKKPLEVYFPIFEQQRTVIAPLEKMKCLDKFKISTIVKGGGSSSQAEAIRHGITRALVLFNPDFRKRLKKTGYLTRDPRMRERKKFGLKRARRAPQWQKR
jgi:small subunit ribosomal protein S9